jgi:hypothetical protein
LSAIPHVGPGGQGGAASGGAGPECDPWVLAHAQGLIHEPVRPGALIDIRKVPLTWKDRTGRESCPLQFERHFGSEDFPGPTPRSLYLLTDRLQGGRDAADPGIAGLWPGQGG